jgi:O-antigen/teichoic acid export membrane protein
MDRDMQQLKDTLVKNVLWNFFGQGWLLVVTFFSVPYIVGQLGASSYGILALVGVIAGYLSFLQLGMGSAMVKYIAQYLSEDNTVAARETFWSCLFVYIFMGSLGTLAIFFSAHVLVERAFHIPDEYRAITLFAIQVGALSFLLAMVSGALSGVLKAVGRFDVLNRVLVVLGTCQTGFSVLLLYYGFSLKEIILLDLFMKVAGICTYGFLAARFLPFLGPPCWDTVNFIRLLKFGGFVTISGIVDPILMNIEKVFLSAAYPVTMLTYYTIPFSLMTRLSIIPASLSSVLFPTFSHYQGVKDAKTIQDLHYRGTLYIFLLLGFPVFFIIIFSRPFLAVWLDAEFAIRSTEILSILALAGLINALAHPSYVALQGLGRPSLPATFHVFETIVHVPACYFLISYYGGIGAALAWLLRVSIDTVLMQCASCHVLQINPLLWYRSLIRRGSMPIFACGFLLLSIRWSHTSFLHPITMALVLAGFALYGYLIWSWSLDAAARQRFTRLAGSTLK